MYPLAECMQHAFFDIVDLKIRVPPHLAQKLPAVLHEQPAEEPPPPKKDTPSLLLALLTLPFAPLAACLASLVSLLVVGEGGGREPYASCLYLLLTPFTIPILLGFSLCHAGCRWFTCALACLSLTMGNMAAVISCSKSPLAEGPARLWLVSCAMVGAVLQKLLLIHKGNVVLLMFSTASAVVVCCLALVAPLLPSVGMSYRCYQSMSLPMLWLCWQATGFAQKKNGTSPV